MTERIRAPGSGSTVSVEEHQALQASHTVLLDQFEAANEVLSAIGRSAGDPDTVLTTDRRERSPALPVVTPPTSTSSRTASTG